MKTMAGCQKAATIAGHLW